MDTMRDPLYPVSFFDRTNSSQSKSLPNNHVEATIEGGWSQYETRILGHKVTISVASADPNDPIAWSKPGVALARSLILRKVIELSSGEELRAFVHDGPENLPAETARQFDVELNLAALTKIEAELGFRGKIDQTLATIYRRWLGDHKPFDIPNPFDDQAKPGRFKSAEEHDDGHLNEEDGTAYGASGSEAAAVFSALAQSGLIGRTAQLSNLWHLTPKGIDRAQDLAASVSSSEGFLVRKYDLSDDHEAALTQLIGGSNVDAKISAVWAEEHNEKIDDRIFRKIKESAFVVVDVPRKREEGSNEESHNVGLEQGYALALGRPMICVHYLAQRQPLSLPFDIQYHNCLAYGPGADRNAGAVFNERVRLALEANRLAVPLLDL